MPLVILSAFTLLTTYYVIQDARRRGINNAFWGSLTALTAGLALPVYLIRRRAKPADT